MKVAYFAYRPWALRIFDTVEIKYPKTSLEKADVVLYYGWSWLIPPEIYENKLCLILHVSPLPKYRGGSPIQHQIINGEKYSAATILRVREKIDTGEIYSQTKISLDGDLLDIWKRLVKVGTIDTLKVLDQIEKDIARPRKQNESKATYYKRRKPEESEIKIEDLKNKTSEQLYNFIRALADPYPNAFIKCKDGKKLYLTGASLESQEESVIKL